MEANDWKDFFRLKDIAVPPQWEPMIEQALYDVGLNSITSLGITYSVTLFFLSIFKFYTDFFILIAAMQPRVWVSAADICTHAAKKKVATEAWPSQPSKKGRVTTLLARDSDIPSEMVFEPVLTLSAPTMLPKVPSAEDGMVREDGAVTVPSMAPSIEVQIGVRVAAEPEQSVVVPVVPPVEYSRA